MHLSTRGRYAVMALLDLVALQGAVPGAPVTLAQIADRQDLSLSYLEQLFAKLRRAGLVKSVRGPGGGYVLAAAPHKTWLADVVKAVDEETDLTRCEGTKTIDLPPNKPGCVHGTKCNAHDLWVALSLHIESFLQQVNLAMVLDGTVKHDFTNALLGCRLPSRVQIMPLA